MVDYGIGISATIYVRVTTGYVSSPLKEGFAHETHQRQIATVSSGIYEPQYSCIYCMVGGWHFVLFGLVIIFVESQYNCFHVLAVLQPNSCCEVTKKIVCIEKDVVW